jgi:hypothetical protein
MQTLHDGPGKKDYNWVPTIALGWVHFAIAACFAATIFAAAIPPILGLLGMILFGGIAMVFILGTITRLR